MDDDPIYRGAFTLSLVAGLVAALVLLALLTLTGVARPFDRSWGDPGLSRAAGGYAMLRLVMGYAGLFVLLKTMQSAGGGLIGRAVTLTAMALAFGVILLGTFLPGWMAPARAAGAGAGSAAGSDMAFNFFAVLVPHTVGVGVAGWIHGD